MRIIKEIKHAYKNEPLNLKRISRVGVKLTLKNIMRHLKYKGKYESITKNIEERGIPHVGHFDDDEKLRETIYFTALKNKSIKKGEIKTASDIYHTKLKKKIKTAVLKEGRYALKYALGKEFIKLNQEGLITDRELFHWQKRFIQKRTIEGLRIMQKCGKLSKHFINPDKNYQEYIDIARQNNLINPKTIDNIIENAPDIALRGPAEIFRAQYLNVEKLN